MEARFLERINQENKSSLNHLKDRLYIEDNVTALLKKGAVVFYEFNDSFLKYELLDDFCPLVWKSPDAFLDSITDFIEEDITLNKRR